MAKKLPNKKVTKQKGGEGTVHPSPQASDFGAKRRERICQGREILGKVKERVNELELSRFKGIFDSSPPVATTTRKKYLLEEIQAISFDKGREMEDVQLDVDLARLADLSEMFDDPELKDAIRSSRLSLTKSSLRTLLKSSGDELEKAVRKQLDDQI